MTDTNSLTHTATHLVKVREPNEAPTAACTATPTSGQAPLEVAFDGTASTDPDGTIVSWGWDFDGDGTVDQTTTTPTVSYSYQAGGTFTPRLTVTDDRGGTHTAAGSTITVAPPVNLDWVEVRIAGGINYTNSGTLTEGNIAIGRSATGTIKNVTGTGKLPSTSGTGTATVRFDVKQPISFLPLYLGDVYVSDPAGGVSGLSTMVFFGTVSPVAADGARASHSWFAVLPPLQFVSYNLTWTAYDRS